MWDGRRENRHNDRKKVSLYLGLGSNQGDRELNIEHAVSMLNVELKTPYRTISSLIETEPWGFESQQKFINAVVLYELDLPEGYNAEAEGLMILEICKDIERKMGRSSVPQYDAGWLLHFGEPFGSSFFKCRQLGFDVYGSRSGTSRIY